MYNVLEKLRAGVYLDTKEQAVHDQGPVNDELDALVQAAYSGEGTLSNQDVLLRLTELNAMREQEELQGLIRHLRPEYQDPRGVATRALELDVGRLPRRRRPSLPTPRSSRSRRRWCARRCKERLGPSLCSRWPGCSGTRARPRWTGYWRRWDRSGRWARRTWPTPRSGL